MVMATTTLNLSVVNKRMLSKGEAAHYCGLGVKRFDAECPVRPVRIVGRDLWDIHELDIWLDSLKEINEEDSGESIVARLG